MDKRSYEKFVVTTPSRLKSQADSIAANPKFKDMIKRSIQKAKANCEFVPIEIEKKRA